MKASVSWLCFAVWKVLLGTLAAYSRVKAADGWGDVIIYNGGAVGPAWGFGSRPKSASPRRRAWSCAGPSHTQTAPQTARGRRAQTSVWVWSRSKKNPTAAATPRRLVASQALLRPPRLHQAAGERCQAETSSRPLVPFICWLGMAHLPTKSLSFLPCESRRRAPPRCISPVQAQLPHAVPIRKWSQRFILHASISLGSWGVLENFQSICSTGVGKRRSACSPTGESH